VAKWLSIQRAPSVPSVSSPTPALLNTQESIQWAGLKQKLNNHYPLTVLPILAESFGFNREVYGANPITQLPNVLDHLKQQENLPLFVQAVDSCAPDYLESTKRTLRDSPFAHLFFSD
jgi:hypothetical protein